MEYERDYLSIYLAIFSYVQQLLQCYCPGIQILSIMTSAPCEMIIETDSTKNNIT